MSSSVHHRGGIIITGMRSGATNAAGIARTAGVRNTAVSGSANVTVTAATSTKGKQIKVGIGADDMPAKRFIFKMKDGGARVVVVLPSATVTETEDIVFVKNDAIKLGVTLGAAPDSTGKSIYIYTDDGIFSSPA